jgi:copper chaperone NosL
VRAVIEKANRILDEPLDVGPRILLILAALLVLPSYLAPLYNMTMFAPQYPDGLRLHIYSYQLRGGNEGQDVKEINVLNHYIGMKDLAAEDFTEFKWLPFAVGIFGLLFLRAAVHGKLAGLVDMLVLYVYFGMFALWSFVYKMYWYGHHLDPKAAVRVDAFTPPLFGYKKLANFEIYSYPALGSYALAFVALCLFVALALAWRDARQSRRSAPTEAT